MKKLNLQSNLVSVILPAYNTPEQFLREAIESVLAQTYTNWELLIIDDSTAAPVEDIVKAYSDDRIKYFRNPQNIGMANSRNRGLELAEGDFIALLDHDDIWLPEKLSESMKVFQVNEGAVLVYSDTVPVGDFADRRINLKKAEGWVFSTVIMQNPILSMSCSVINKTFLEAHNIKFNDDCVPCDDWDFHLQCALHGKLYCTPEPLVKYRYHQNNLSSNAVKMYNAGINVINKYQAMMPMLVEHSGCTRRTLQKSIDHIAFKHYYGLAFEHLKKQEKTQALRYIIKAFLYRPLKCIGKILRFAGKKALKK